jgi:hypothetical protein
MQQISEVIHSSSRDYTNTSDSEVKNTNTNTSVKSLREVQLIANKLEQALGKQIPSRYPYYCKVARELPENLIWNSLEAAMKGQYPPRLFSYLSSQYMKKAPTI